MTSITIPSGVINIGTNAFYGNSSLTTVYFKGNAPNADSTVFSGDNVIVFYLPGASGWGKTFGGRPTKLWNPQAETSGTNFGIRTNSFGFNIIGTSNLVIVVDCCTNLASSVWLPLSTNTLNTSIGTNGISYFSDSQWTNYPRRYYRLRSP